MGSLMRRSSSATLLSLIVPTVRYDGSAAGANGAGPRAPESLGRRLRQRQIERNDLRVVSRYDGD